MFWTNIKELFFAHYNSQTDMIEDCREGSLAWHHEKRHLWQFSLKPIKYANFVTSLAAQTFSFGALIFLIRGDINGFKLALAFIGASWLPFMMIILPLELDAWVYSIRMKLK